MNCESVSSARFKNDLERTLCCFHCGWRNPSNASPNLKPLFCVSMTNKNRGYVVRSVRHWTTSILNDYLLTFGITFMSRHVMHINSINDVGYSNIIWRGKNSKLLDFSAKKYTLSRLELYIQICNKKGECYTRLAVNFFFQIGHRLDFVNKYKMFIGNSWNMKNVKIFFKLMYV